MTYKTGKSRFQMRFGKSKFPFPEFAGIRKKRRFAFSVFTVIPRCGAKRKFLLFAGERFVSSLAALGTGDKIKA